jgi:glycosyltransferase involved in cell wall biosynthesis
MDTGIQVSVVIPTYNASQKLRECLEALQKQTYPRERYEIIVVDDGSTDDTKSIIEVGGGRFPIRYCFQENKGPAAARNRGAGMAQGDVILFTDADCVPSETWIQEIVSPFRNPGIVAVKGAYETNQRSLWARFAQVEFSERYHKLLKQDYIDMVDTYSAGFRRDVFLSMGGFDPSFPFPNNEDTDLSYRMSLRGYKMVFNPNAIVWHSGHPDNFKGYMKLKFWRGYWRMVVYRRYSNKIIKDSYTPQTLKLQICLAFLSLSCWVLMWLLPSAMPYAFVICIILFLMSSVEFMRLALRNDKRIGILSPFFLFMRAIALGSGILYYLLKRPKDV